MTSFLKVLGVEKTLSLWNTTSISLDRPSVMKRVKEPGPRKQVNIKKKTPLDINEQDPGKWLVGGENPEPLKNVVDLLNVKSI